MLNHRGKGWIAAFALAAAALVLAPAAFADGLRVELAPVSDKAVLGPDDGVPLRFTVTNETDSALTALYWHTPFRGFETDMFVVELNGRRVDYTDRIVLRLPPEAGDWMQIGPGESVSTVFDLARSYDMSEPGTYAVEFDFPIETRGSESAGEQAPARVRSDVLLVSTTGVRKGQQFEKGGPPSSGGCSTEEFQILDARQAVGDGFAQNADAHMDGSSDPASDLLYNKWFGAYDVSRWTWVNDGFENIDATMDLSFTYNCINCGRTMVAYVYKDQPRNVWICPTFFTLDENFQGGVLLHEASHWNRPAGAGTNDYAYGESSCLSLAASSPANAVNNADNYHLFSRDVSGALP